MYGVRLPACLPALPPQARAGVLRAFGARYGGVGVELVEQLVAARLAAEARA